MIDLYLHKRKLDSVFELLGSKENDITYSLGWAFAQCPCFLRAFLARICPENHRSAIERITLQDFRKKEGITDVEILSPDIHLIIEAKRGWTVPDPKQLQKYADRLRASSSSYRAFVAMAESTPEYAALELPKTIGEFPVHYLSWKEVAGLSRIKTGKHAEKRLLHELRTYLGRIVTMQNQESNMVYVVAVATGTPHWSHISWQDIVNKRRYFHPHGRNGWPKEPPNYLAFRYGGQLRGIHHVRSCKVVKDLNVDIPEIHLRDDKGLLLYELDEAIVPSHPVRTGRIFRNGRVWAMLDLLLTSETIAEARDKTKKRAEKI